MISAGKTAANIAKGISRCLKLSRGETVLLLPEAEFTCVVATWIAHS